MTTETSLSPALMEKTLIGGDLAKLTPAERLAFYSRVCESLGVNPLTRPFAYITLNGRLTLYATRDCTDQLRKIHGVSVEIVERTPSADVFIVRAKATIAGRTDESLGAVSIAGLKGEALANSLMKAETKSKRRVTLSICGLTTIGCSTLEPRLTTGRRRSRRPGKTLNASYQEFISREQRQALKAIAADVDREVIE